MRRLITSLSALTLIVLLAACDPVAESTTTTDPVLPPPDGAGSTSSTVPVSTTEFVRARQHDYRGVLPDGVSYTATLLGAEQQELQEIKGDFVVEVDGSQLRAAEVSYRKDGGQGTEYAEGHNLVTAGGWSIFIDFNQDALEALGNEAESIITASIHPIVKSGFPVLRLADPFSWDYEQYPVEARYQTFVVRRFCGELAIACNDIGSVQLIPAERLYPGLAPLDAQAFAISSFDTRSVFDPYFLDPGPLSPATMADVIWTADEMIVWGGGQSGEPYLIEGARFEPEEGTWTMLPAIPLSEEQPTRSMWLTKTLLVVSEEGTYAYSPQLDTWDHIEGIGVKPPRDPGFMAAVSPRVYLWNTEGIFSLALDSPAPEWLQIPRPPFESGNAAFGDRWFSAMVATGQSLYLGLRSDDGCGPREIAEWNGVRWRLLPPVSLATEALADCSFANQMAAIPGGLVIWDPGHPTMVYSAEHDTWHEAEPIPLGGTEGPSGAVLIDDRFFMVPQNGQAAFFDIQSETWAVLDVPGSGGDLSMVWTGEEILAWGIFESFDAWRWTPGRSVIEGDDTT